MITHGSSYIPQTCIERTKIKILGILPNSTLTTAVLFLLLQNASPDTPVKTLKTVAENLLNAQEPNEEEATLIKDAKFIAEKTINEITQNKKQLIYKLIKINLKTITEVFSTLLDAIKISRDIWPLLNQETSSKTDFLNFVQPEINTTIDLIQTYDLRSQELCDAVVTNNSQYPNSNFPETPLSYIKPNTSLIQKQDISQLTCALYCIYKLKSFTPSFESHLKKIIERLVVTTIILQEIVSIFSSISPETFYSSEIHAIIQKRDTFSKVVVDASDLIIQNLDEINHLLALLNTLLKELKKLKPQ